MKEIDWSKVDRAVLYKSDHDYASTIAVKEFFKQFMQLYGDKLK